MPSSVMSFGLPHWLPVPPEICIPRSRESERFTCTSYITREQYTSHTSCLFLQRSVYQGLESQRDSRVPPTSHRNNTHLTLAACSSRDLYTKVLRVREIHVHLLHHTGTIHISHWLPVPPQICIPRS